MSTYHPSRQPPPEIAIADLPSLRPGNVVIVILDNIPWRLKHRVDWFALDDKPESSTAHGARFVYARMKFGADALLWEFSRDAKLWRAGVEDFEAGVREVLG